MALSLFGEKLDRYNGLSIPAQNACHLKSSGLVPALEMEMSSLALHCVAGALFAMLWEWGVVSLLWCGGGSSPKKLSAIYHESLRTQPKLDRKCDVSVAWCWCGVVVVVVVVVCRWFFVVLWIVFCCVVGRRRCVVGYVNFIVHASAGANTTCHVHDCSPKPWLYRTYVVKDSGASRASVHVGVLAGTTDVP